jgi:AraC-like DNA-binding protein
MTSLAYPFEGSADMGSTISLCIERDQLLSIADQLDRLNHRVLEGITAQIAIEFLKSMAQLLPTTSMAEIPIFVETALIVIQGFITQADPLDLNPTRPIMAVRLEMVKRHIQENLSSNRLEPDDICAAMRLSRRQLYYLFEELGGVSAYVRKRRLIAIHEAIADPAEHRPIHAIAAEFGFYDAALFSRQFKAQFGYSPKEAREQRLQGYAPPPVPPRIDKWLAQIRGQ